MMKGKRGICIAAIVAALAAPCAWADDSSAPGFFEALLAQLQAIWIGEDVAAADINGVTTANADQPELGPILLPNG